MLIFCHLWAGAFTGMILNRNKYSLIFSACLLGSILPDIIDKPLGHIVFPGLDNGRLIMHSLLIMGSFLLLTLFSGRFQGIFLGLTAGIISHQILDMMWADQVTWFYPLLGPFPQLSFENYFQSFIFKELATPSEWIFAFSIPVIWMVNRETLEYHVKYFYSGVPAAILLLTGH